jgi:PAS domain-containing protein
MTHEATLDMMLLLATCLVTAVAGLIVWLRVRVPGAKALALLLGACAVNSGAYALEFATPSLAGKVDLEKLLTVGSVTMPTLWFVFALQFSGRGRVLTRRVSALLCVMPVVAFVLAMTNGWHHLFWDRLYVSPGGQYLALDPAFGPAFWVHAVYSYALLAAGTVLLLQLFWRSRNLYRGQAAALLVAVLLPWVVDVVGLFGLAPRSDVDLTTIAYCLAAILLAFVLPRLRVGDVLAVSRANILDSLEDAVVVLDARGRVLYQNPAGEGFVGRFIPGALPEALAAVWPASGDVEPRPADGKVEHAAVCWTDDAGASFDLRTSPVLDGNRQAMAHVLVARDVTDQRRVEEDLRTSGARLEQAFDATVEALAAVGESRDPYTRGHQRRVRDLARAIAVELGIEGDRLRGLCVAAEVHDVGKIRVPVEILSKPGRLTDPEWQLVKQHAEAGYEILKGIAFPWPVADIVRQHHEKMDGSGYPLGLHGDDVLLEARVLCVADVVEAMASNRPYRPALGVEAALDEVARHRGALFDADAVDACLRIFADGSFRLEDA